MFGSKEGAAGTPALPTIPTPPPSPPMFGSEATKASGNRQRQTAASAATILGSMSTPTNTASKTLLGQ